MDGSKNLPTPEEVQTYLEELKKYEASKGKGDDVKEPSVKGVETAWTLSPPTIYEESGAIGVNMLSPEDSTFCDWRIDPVTSPEEFMETNGAYLELVYTADDEHSCGTSYPADKNAIDHKGNEIQARIHYRPNMKELKDLDAIDKAANKGGHHEITFNDEAPIGLSREEFDKALETGTTTVQHSPALPAVS
eukprot:GHVO01012123.1.p1 GENE.GHVO01012123.1~~GHVO01012123.1.p1  ORF type:complete len:221 (+),score=36.10 GHVO01012123.1:91-663(+)